jgi:hypothetical protein
MLGLFCLIGSALWLHSTSGQEALPIPAAAPSRRDVQAAPVTLTVRGAGSCAATACHGSIVEHSHAKVLRNEHTTWVSYDKHSLAFESLSSDLSQRIVKNLAAGGGHCEPAEKNSRCLACHATPRPEAEAREAAWINQDGVGCESCHGPSGDWLGAHTSESWYKMSEFSPDQRGFRNIKNLVRRAEICVDCHVGRPVRESDSTESALPEVNHDLIAAGHPRLAFELSAYQANMPPHWREKDRNSAPDQTARLWAVGQLVSARAALDLLADRASHKSAPWPEFSEYDCYSCHHSLANEKWRREPRTDFLGNTSAAGALSYGTWYLPLVDFARSIAPTKDDNGLQPIVKGLLAEMARPKPNEKQVAQFASEASRRLSANIAAIADRPFSVDQLATLARTLNDPVAWKKVGNWDEATVRYLALVPLYQALMKRAPDQGSEREIKRELETLQKKLAFPRDAASPRNFDPTRILER